MPLISLIALILATFLSLLAEVAAAQSQRPIVLDPSYRHDRWETRPVDVLRQFRAYTVSFDSADDDNGDGAPDVLGVPEWVAYEVRRFEGSCVPTAPRPSRWFTDRELNDLHLAPGHDSYAMPEAFRARRPDWFVRGHLAMKFLAERLGADAAWNTHSVLNALPQRAGFNERIWADVELLTGAWANRFGAVWIVTGPVFRRSLANRLDRRPWAQSGEGRGPGSAVQDRGPRGDGLKPT